MSVRSRATTPRPSRGRGALIALAVALLAGASRGSAATSPVQDRSLPVELPPQRETKVFDLGVDGWLELKNIAGDITVNAGPGRAATVEIVRRARGKTDADARLGLQRVTVDVADRGGRALVETTTSGSVRAGYTVVVSYIVTAPAGTHLTIGSISGAVVTNGIKGDLSVDVTSGDIQLTDAGRITAKTVSGDIDVVGATTDGSVALTSISGDLDLQRVKARRVSATGVSGGVVARDVVSDDVQLSAMTGDVEFAGVPAPNGRYELQSYSGVVRLRVPVNANFELKAETFSGTLRVEPGIALKSAAGGLARRIIRGTVGNGSATVNAHTFSGDIIVARRQ